MKIKKMIELQDKINDIKWHGELTKDGPTSTWFDPNTRLFYLSVYDATIPLEMRELEALRNRLNKLLG